MLYKRYWKICYPGLKMISPLLKHPLLDIALEDLSGPKEAVPNKANPELLNEESECKDPEPISEEMQGTEEADQRPPNLEQQQETLQEWESYGAAK